MSCFSIVIPVYFNQASLLPLYSRLMEIETGLREIGVDLQLIFVNDGSRDESLDRLKEIKHRRPATIVINHLSNQGSMTAIKSGLAHVKGDCFTYLAADLQDPPELLMEMVGAWKAGSRFVVRVRSSRSDPPLTTFLAWINYKMVRWLVIKDYPAGGYDMAVWDKVFLSPMRRCGHNKNLAMYAWSLGVEPKVFTYHRESREHGKSMWTFRKKLNYFIDSTVGFSIKPLRYASIFGLLLAMFCFTYVAVVIVARLYGFISVPGFSALAAMVGFLNGCGFIFIGLLGEYVWRIYTEVSQRTEVLSEEVILQPERPSVSVSAEARDKL